MKMKYIAACTAVLLWANVAEAGVLPDLPAPFKYGSGVISGNTIYIGLGSYGKDWYKIDGKQKDAKWQPIAPFPGNAREQATSVLIDGNIYVFGGVGKNAQGDIGLFHDSYQYNIKENLWKKLDTHPPVNLAGHVSFTHNGKAISTGGVNENIFNGYFADVKAAADDQQRKEKIDTDYFSKAIPDYFLNRSILSFDPKSGQWKNLGELPFPGTAGSSVVTSGDSVILLNGERKPGLRSTEVHVATLSDDKISWQSLPPVAGPDGVSGAYAGISDKEIILAGGAYFPGASAQYDDGHYWSHKGLTKTYSKNIYLFSDGHWKNSGELPKGLAYGVSLAWQDGLLMLGGETRGGQAVADINFIKVVDGKISINK